MAGVELTRPLAPSILRWTLDYANELPSRFDQTDNVGCHLRGDDDHQCVREREQFRACDRLREYWRVRCAAAGR